MAGAQKLATAYYELIASTPGAEGQISSAILPAVQTVGSQAGSTLGKGIAAASSPGLGDMAAKVVKAGQLAAAGLATGLVAGAKKAVGSFTDVTGAAVSMQRTIGGSVTDASKLVGAFSMVGIGSQQAQMGLKTFSTKLEQASTDSGKAADMSKQLGTNILDASGHVKSMNDILPAVADKFKTMPDGVEKTALAVQLFGRTGLQMLPMLNKGSAGIQDMEKKTQALGLTVSDVDQKNFGDFMVSTRTMAGMFKGLGVQIGGTIIPAFSGIQTAIVNICLPAFEKIEATFDKFAPKIQAVGNALQNVGPGFAGLKQALGIVGPGAVAASAGLGVLAAGGFGQILSSLPIVGSALSNFTSGPLSTLSGGLGNVVKDGLNKFGSALLGLPGPLKAVGIGIAAVAVGGAIFDKFGPQITDFVNKLPALVSSFTAAIPGIVAHITAAIPQIITTITTALTTMVPQLVAGAAQLITAVAAALPQLIGPIIAALPVLITAIINGLNTVIPMLITAAVQIITALANGLIQMAPMLISSAVQIVMQLATGILGMLPQIISAGIQLVMALVNGLIQMLPQIITSGVQLITQLFTSIIGMLPQLIQAGVQLIMALVTGLINMLPQIIQSGIQLVLTLFTSLIGMLPQLISAGIQLIIALAVGLVQAIPQLVGEIPAIVSAVINAFSQVDWGSVGMQIIQGIASGITGAVGGLLSAAKNAAMSALNSIKGALGIHSPSRVFRDQVGAQISAGMALGISDTSTSVTKAANKVADDVAKTNVAMTVGKPDVESVSPSASSMQSDGAAMFAAALQGMALTLLVEGKPVSAVVDARIATNANSANGMRS